MFFTILSIAAIIALAVDNIMLRHENSKLKRGFEDSFHSN